MTLEHVPSAREKRTVLVLASTYPRWANDHEPGFVHELCRRLTTTFNVIAIVPDAPGADPSGVLDDVEVVRYRYAPRSLQTLVNDGGIASNLRRTPWKWMLVPGFVFMQYVSVRRLLRTRNIEAIHAHWLISPGIVARAVSRRGIPYLVTSHGGDLFGFRQPLLIAVKRWVAKSAAAMTVVSSAMHEEVLRLQLPVKRLETIPMGVDFTRRFASTAQIERSKSELLFVGRLVEKKGLVYLLDAMPLIVRSRPDVVLRIVGFGPERDALRQRVKDLAMQDHVVFAGAMEQNALPDIYRRAAVFVAPFVRDVSGDQEGLPVALMEAISTGCPFVVGDVAGLDDLLGNSAAAYRIDPRDPAAIAASVLHCLAHPGAAAVVAEKVRETARKRVDWSVIAKRYELLISDCMGSFPQ
jgi:glycosyltransferase involved in cell wall biosynthesis